MKALPTKEIANSTINSQQLLSPNNKPVYSFQTQTNSQQHTEQTGDMKSGYQTLVKSPTNTTNYSSTKKSNSFNGGGMQYEGNDNSEKLALTEMNNMSVIQEEGILKGDSYQSSMIKEQTPSNKNHILKSQKPSSTSLLSHILPMKHFCKIHFEKAIEYFCQQCYSSVCSKCMFLNHNGHDLIQIEDALNTMKTKIEVFDHKVIEAMKDNDDTRNLLQKCKDEIESVRGKQQSIIDMRFKELQQRLEDRKAMISKDIMHRFDNAIFKVNDKMRMIKELSDELRTSKDYYSSILLKLSDEKILKEEVSSNQVHVLEKIPEYEKFISEKTLMLKSHLLSQKNTKLEYQDGMAIGMKPIDISVQNALNLIQSIHLDDNNSAQPLIILKQIPYKDIKNKPTSQQDSHQFSSLNSTTKNLEASFAYPSRLQSNNQLGQNIIQQKLPNLALNTIGRSKSQVNNQENITTSVDDSNEQATYKSSQKPSNNHVITKSKFAKMRFERGSIEASQELCLQIEKQNSDTTEPNDKIIQQKEDSKSQSLDQEQLEEIQSNNIKVLDNAIYCIGDTRFMLMFDYKNQLWQKLYFDKHESDYQGTLKFMSICQINTKKREFIMTGGCNKASKEASSQCFRFSIPSIRTFREVQRMNQPRYGHASVFINQLVLVLGGFNHRDDEAQAPNTINTCEKYSIKENEWTPIAPMHQERAYFSACRVKDEFIYVFGGFQNYETTNSIEFYNIMLDKWTLLSVTMPIKIAKYGLSKLEENQIVIAGGLLIDNGSTRSQQENANYSCVNTVYKFDCNTLKWTKLAKLNFRRNMYSNMALKDNLQIFAIGGTVDGINEVYDLRKKKWSTCQSYTSIMGQNDLQTYAICSLSSQ